MLALLLEQQDGSTLAKIDNISPLQLPAGDVVVNINWSGINYKDALAITGRGKIIRRFPMIPGIDFAGQVASSENPRFHSGQSVLLTGWGVGEHHWGGLAQQARVPGDWLLPLPTGLDTRQAMIIGTAGLTAMLCVMALEEGGIRPEKGEVLVTGASGGVGSTAVALLAALGYRVVAVSGRESTRDYLSALGAQRILARSRLLDAERPLEAQQWAGAVDTVGGSLLARILAQMNYGSTVAACGLAGGATLPTSVLPFILRQVRLQGVDSVQTPVAQRQLAWQRLAATLPAHFYPLVAREVSLEQAVTAATELLENRITGRILVKVR